MQASVVLKKNLVFKSSFYRFFGHVQTELNTWQYCLSLEQTNRDSRISESAVLDD